MAQVHIGKKIKEVVAKSDFSVTEFAKKINRSRDVAYKIFAKEHMDTTLLQRICNVLEHDFFSYYSNELAFNRYAGNDASGVLNDPETGYGKKEEMKQLVAELKACKKQVGELEKKYELSEKVNRLMEEKIETMKARKK